MFTKPSHKTIIKTSLKLSFSLAALYYIFTHIEIAALQKQLKYLSPTTLLLTFCLTVFSQYIAGLRFKFYCRSKEILLEKTRAIKLYFIGLFFNNLLPGGIGGDGYIAVILKHNHGSPIKQNIQLLLSARANGLLALILISCVASLFSDYVHRFNSGYVFITIFSLLTLCCYSLSVKYLFGESYRTQCKASAYSFMIQGAIALLMYILLLDMQVPQSHLTDYLALLLFSSVLIIIPISFGGLGLRELGFLKGSMLMGLNAEIGVAISLLYFSFNLILSLPGAVFFLQNKHAKQS